MTTAKYYYESHITIEPVFDVRLQWLKDLAKQYKFRVADLMMKKREQDTEQRSTNDTFLTGHGKDYDDIVNRTRLMAGSLTSNEFKIYRYKIEDTLVDSRYSDDLRILSVQDEVLGPN